MKFQVQDEYVLVLTLTDGRLGDGSFIKQRLIIVVEDINDNSPTFLQHQGEFSIPENSAPGILTAITASDKDEGAYGQVCNNFLVYIYFELSTVF